MSSSTLSHHPDLPAIDTNLEEDPFSPKRIMLISIPGTAVDILSQILNIPKQPKVLFNRALTLNSTGFRTAVDRDLIHSALKTWTYEDKLAIFNTNQSSLYNMEKYSAAAAKQEKILVSRANVSWFINPASPVWTGDESDDDGDPDNDDEEILAKREQAWLFTVDVSRKYAHHVISSPTPSFLSLCGEDGYVNINPTNHTVFPNEYLHTWRAIFVIHHPIQTIPLLYRRLNTMQQQGRFSEDMLVPVFKLNADMRAMRKMYLWYMESHCGPKTPIQLIVDVADVIYKSETVLVDVCREVGLDESVIDHVAAYRLMGEMGLVNAGLVLNGLEKLVAVLFPIWVREFGLDAAGLIRGAVREAMPHYEYLKERRVGVPHGMYGS
ncbi:hypothetical protein BJX99DRAFT_255390 [Aspergillus californicus]